MQSTFSSYNLVARDLGRTLSAVQRQPSVKTETAYYLSKIVNVKSADDFVADRRLLKYAMTAFGLKDMAYATAFVRKILVEGHDDPSAFANKLTDARYVEFAKIFDFKRYGAATTSFSATKQDVADKYARQMLESSSGAGNEGVRLALYFERVAPHIVSAAEILADKALSEVARTALRLPSSFALIGIDKQISIIEDRLKIEDFRSPAKLSKFLQRFAAMWDLDGRSEITNSAALIFNKPRQSGISETLLASLTQFRTRSL